MEKISLLLLLVKKTLIGTAIAGLIGLGGLKPFFNGELNKNDDDKKNEKTISIKPSRPGVPPAY